jgi:hypothetical protein
LGRAGGLLKKNIRKNIMSEYYKLNGKEVVECDNLLDWAKWYETADRIVKKDKIGDAEVSTVFLGLNHGWDGKILLFETMIFGGEFDDFQDRYETWEEAEIGHQKAIEKILNNKAGYLL